MLGRAASSHAWVGPLMTPIPSDSMVEWLEHAGPDLRARMAPVRVLHVAQWLFGFHWIFTNSSALNTMARSVLLHGR